MGKLGLYYKWSYIFHPTYNRFCEAHPVEMPSLLLPSHWVWVNAWSLKCWAPDSLKGNCSNFAMLGKSSNFGREKICPLDKIRWIFSSFAVTLVICADCSGLIDDCRRVANQHGYSWWCTCQKCDCWCGSEWDNNVLHERMPWKNPSRN